LCAFSDTFLLLLFGCSGAVRIEKYEDRVRDFSGSWKQLFGWLNFGSIDEFEKKYCGMLLVDICVT